MTELSLSTRKKQTRSKSASHANITTYFWKVHWRSFDNQSLLIFHLYHYNFPINSICIFKDFSCLQLFANVIEKHNYKTKKTPNTTNGIENRKRPEKKVRSGATAFTWEQESEVVTWESH